MRTLSALVLLAGAVLLHGGVPQPLLVIRGATVIDGVSAAPRIADIHVRGELIESVTTGPPPAGAQVVDAAGKFAVPALWDMHVHAAMRPEPGITEEAILPSLLAHGIVGVRDMGAAVDTLPALRRAAKATGLRLIAPGPFVDGPGDAAPFFRRLADAAAAAAEVASLQKEGADFIKVQSGLARGTHDAVIAAARARGLMVAGHIPVSMTAEEVIASGQRSIEHVSPALVGDGLLLFACSSQADALIAELRTIEAARGSGDAAALGRREAALRQRAVDTYDPARARQIGASLKHKDVWIVPTLVWSASLRPTSASADGRDLPMDLVPRALRTRWTDRRTAYIAQVGEDGLKAAARLAETSGRAIADMHAAGAKVLAGTDAFDAFVIPGDSLHQELQLLVSGGLSPMSALRSATVEAARYRGSSDKEGTLEPGRRADVLLLDADPLADIANTRRIHGVVGGGRLHDRPALDALLARVRSFADRQAGR